MKNFWNNLPKPFTVLAPMEDVTDIVFRKIIDDTYAPDVYFTEFVNCEGLMSQGREKVIHRLKRDKELNSNKPTVAQIWGIKPENYFEVAKLCNELGFDGIDINMGCPQRNVTKTGACSALIKNHTLAKEIIQATQEGSKNIPVSVKTRIGFNKIAIDEWISFLLEQNLPALSVHLRTTKEMSKVPAHWELIDQIIDLRNKINQETLIVGNGDIKNYSDIKQKHEDNKIDGGMIGRGIFKNINAFNKIDDSNNLTFMDSLKTCKKHIELFEKTWGKSKKYDILKKYYKIYISDYPESKNIKNELMSTNSTQEAISIINREINK